MRSEGAIRHKLKQVKFRHLKARLQETLGRRPTNCQFNGSPPGAQLRVCMYGCHEPSKWQAVVCDERQDGLEQASTCPYFQPVSTKEAVKADFHRELGGMTLPQIAYHYPDLAALLWVLGEETAGQDDLDVEVDLDTPTSSAVPVVVGEPVGRVRVLDWLYAILGGRHV